MEETIILKSNLKLALSMAIEKQSFAEKENFGYDRDSALVAGWKDVLKSLNEGKTVKIK